MQLNSAELEIMLFYENSSQISYSMMEMSSKNDLLLWLVNYSRHILTST